MDCRIFILLSHLPGMKIQTNGLGSHSSPVSLFNLISVAQAERMARCHLTYQFLHEATSKTCCSLQDFHPYHAMGLHEPRKL